MKSLIIFPIAVLFLIALVSSPFSFDEDVEESFIVLRTINETALTNITQQTQIIYVNTEPLIYYFYWENNFVTAMAPVLNNWFGSYSEHENQASQLFYERSDKGSPLVESEVYEIIKYDPKSINETAQLQGFGLSLSGTDKLFVGLFLGMIGIAGVIGIRIFGSGISESSVAIIYKLLVLFLLWGLLSVMTYDAFLEIPYNFGVVIWVVLTFMYAVGGIMTTFNEGD